MIASKTLFAMIAGMTIASAAPVLGQDPHGHDGSAQVSPAAAPTGCPGTGSQATNGSGMGQMQPGMMMGGPQMQQMMQSMQQMHSEMQQMHKEMMQMHQEMQRRKGN